MRPDLDRLNAEFQCMRAELAEAHDQITRLHAAMR